MLKLTNPELNHLMSLVIDNKESGIYWGPKEQFEKRTERILTKLTGELK